jgi:hypothetical protein
MTHLCSTSWRFFTISLAVELLSFAIKARDRRRPMMMMRLSMVIEMTGKQVLMVMYWRNDNMRVIIRILDTFPIKQWQSEALYQFPSVVHIMMRVRFSQLTRKLRVIFEHTLCNNQPLEQIQVPMHA